MSEPKRPAGAGPRLRAGRGLAPLHVVLVLFTLFTLYPILWVVTIAFSGRQNLTIATLPPEPTWVDRLRAITPWPEVWSLSSDFFKYFTDPNGRKPATPVQPPRQ